MEVNNLEKAAITVPDTVFENPVVQERWSVSVQHVVWGLIGIAGFALLGLFILAIVFAFRDQTVPDTIVILITTVVTACVSGLVGFVAGKNANG